MSKVLQERGFGSLPSSTEANPRNQVKSISTTIEADSCPIRLERITKKRTKNEAKTTKPDSQWKSKEKTKPKSKPKSTEVNPNFSLLEDMDAYCDEGMGDKVMLKKKAEEKSNLKTFAYTKKEVIKNGNKVLKRTIGETEQEYKPTTAEEKQDRRNEMKARGTLLIELLNKDQLKFYSYKDAKFLMEAIEKRLQKLISQLEIQGKVITQEDINLKLLRSLPSGWKTHALIWRNKEDIETISLDNLYNILKIYEPELAGSSSTSQNPQNVAFVSSSSINSNCNSSPNEVDNTAHGVSATHTQCNSTSGDNLSDAMICAFLASQPNSPQLAREDLKQIDPDDLEEMDLQWEMAMLTIRARRFIQRTCRKLDVNGQRVRFDKTKVEGYNCHKYGHFARECTVPRNQENRGRENNRRTVTVETPTKNALVAQDGHGGYDWSYQVEEELPTNFALMAHTSLGSSSNSDSEVDSCSKSCVKAYATLKEQYDSLSSYYKRSQFNLVSYKAGLESVEARLAHYKKNEAVFEESFNVLKLEKNNKSKSDKGHHEVPPPFTGIFIPRKPDLTFMDEIVESENMDITSIITPSNVKKVESNLESAGVKKFIPNVKNKSVRPSTEKIKFAKSARETPKQNKQYPRGNQRNWNNLMSQRLGSDFKMINKACFICGSFEHLHYVCDKKITRPVWNNSSTNKIFVPQAVLTRSGKINTAGANVNTVVRPVHTAGSKTTVSHPRPISNAYKKGYTQVIRPFNKATHSRKKYKEKRVIDSGCSRHITGNKCYLTEYEDYDGSFVSFGDGKGLTCLFANATNDESNLWHRRLGHLIFKNMNKLVRGNLVRGLPSKIFENDHSCHTPRRGLDEIRVRRHDFIEHLKYKA
ncbi:ribonuclease H-like domain-containing protein [Tanacetum coccineum]